MILEYVIKNNSTSEFPIEPGEAWKWTVHCDDVFDAYLHIEKIKMMARTHGHTLMNVFLNGANFDAREWYTEGANSDNYDYDPEVVIAEHINEIERAEKQHSRLQEYKTDTDSVELVSEIPGWLEEHITELEANTKSTEAVEKRAAIFDNAIELFIFQSTSITLGDFGENIRSPLFVGELNQRLDEMVQFGFDPNCNSSHPCWEQGLEFIPLLSCIHPLTSIRYVEEILRSKGFDSSESYRIWVNENGLQTTLTPFSMARTNVALSLAWINNYKTYQKFGYSDYADFFVKLSNQELEGELISTVVRANERVNDILFSNIIFSEAENTLLSS